jgi:hypothetical protein
MVSTWDESSVLTRDPGKVVPLAKQMVAPKAVQLDRLLVEDLEPMSAACSDQMWDKRKEAA